MIFSDQTRWWFHHYLGKISHVTSIFFQMGWWKTTNQQNVLDVLIVANPGLWSIWSDRMQIPMRRRWVFCGWFDVLLDGFCSWLFLLGFQDPREWNDFLAGGFKHFLFSPLPGEDEPILTNIMQLGWNHQPVSRDVIFFGKKDPLPFWPRVQIDVHFTYYKQNKHSIHMSP